MKKVGLLFFVFSTKLFGFYPIDKPLPVGTEAPILGGVVSNKTSGEEIYLACIEQNEGGCLSVALVSKKRALPHQERDPRSIVSQTISYEALRKEFKQLKDKSKELTKTAGEISSHHPGALSLKTTCFGAKKLTQGSNMSYWIFGSLPFMIIADLVISPFLTPPFIYNLFSWKRAKTKIKKGIIVLATPNSSLSTKEYVFHVIKNTSIDFFARIQHT